MKIAFDVQGTLNGHKGEILTQIIDDFKNQGIDVFIWSSSYEMAVDMANKIGIPKENCLSKKYIFDYHTEDHMMDFCIDDDSSLKLLARKTFLVHKLPNDYPSLKEFFKNENILK